MSTRPISLGELKTILDHLTPLLDSSENNYTRYMALYKKSGDGTICRTAVYWKNVASGYRHAISIAKQRLPGVKFA